MIPPVAILAGGYATRLAPLSDAVPKSLIRVAGEPFVHHQLRLLAGQNVRDVVICSGHLGHMIRDHLGANWSNSIRLHYSEDGPEPLGTGGAIRKALPLLGPLFMVLYGDSYLQAPLAEVASAFRSGDAPAMMTVFRNQGRWGRSNVVFEDGRLLAYDKHEPQAAMQHIDYGLAVLSAAALDGTPPRFDLADHYAMMARHGILAGFEVTERFYEIGSPAGLAETDLLLRKQA